MEILDNGRTQCGDPLLVADMAVERDAFRLELPVDISGGHVVALLGPNGAGKSTALRALAGLTPLTSGSITLAGRDLDRPDTGVWVPPHERGIGVMFQDYLLFGHLSVLDNVAFGPRRRGMSRADARAVAAGWLDRVGLADKASARPSQLSGGQAQRVALARALAVDPRLLLLDEPLAALDAGTKADTRAALSRHLEAYRGATMLVTHDPLDALILADHLVIVEGGTLVQSGSVAQVTAMPQTEYVARLVGLNLLRGTGSGTAVRIDDFVVHTAEPVTGPACVAIAPASIALYQQRPQGSPRNTWPARIETVHRHGDQLRVALSGPVPISADITQAAAAQLHLAAGTEVWASVKASETHAYPAGCATPTR